MDQRRAVKGKDNVKYKELNTRVNDKCKQAKEKWWNEKCEELEKTPSTAHTKLKELIK